MIRKEDIYIPRKQSWIQYAVNRKYAEGVLSENSEEEINKHFFHPDECVDIRDRLFALFDRGDRYDVYEVRNFYGLKEEMVHKVQLDYTLFYYFSENNNMNKEDKIKVLVEEIDKYLEKEEDIEKIGNMIRKMKLNPLVERRLREIRGK